MESYSESYRKSGVDITAGYAGVKLMAPHVARTRIPGVVSGIGGFGGLFAPDLTGIREPVLVSGTDGVGTKIRIAQLLDRHDTVGVDCVAMCVNDIICSGASPLFFLDYVAVGKNVPSRIEAIVSGVTEGCRQAECALVGGETAEMPGFYPVDEYDLAGFSVGIVDEEKIIDGKKLAAGDVLVGLASSGVHSNGFSLVRKVLDVEHADLKTPREDLNGKSLGEALLAPTRIYVKQVLEVMKSVKIKGMAHITGGGLVENVPRVLPEGVQAVIDGKSWTRPAIFDWLQEKGNIDSHEMHRVFNNGIGLVVIVSAEDAEKARGAFEAQGEKVFTIGTVAKLPEGEAPCVVR